MKDKEIEEHKQMAATMFQTNKANEEKMIKLEAALVEMSKSNEEKQRLLEQKQQECLSLQNRRSQVIKVLALSLCIFSLSL